MRVEQSRFNSNLIFSTVLISEGFMNPKIAASHVKTGMPAHFLHFPVHLQSGFGPIVASRGPIGCRTINKPTKKKHPLQDTRTGNNNAP